LQQGQVFGRLQSDDPVRCLEVFHRNLPLDEAGLLELATTLKQRCGTGGTVKDGVIEIQGDQRERLAAELEDLGYRVKRLGG
jgi:predicted translation initiation factor SUI1